MLDKLRLVEDRYAEMSVRASQPDFYNDPKAATKLLKEQKQLEPIVETYRRYQKTKVFIINQRCYGIAFIQCCNYSLLNIHRHAPLLLYYSFYLYLSNIYIFYKYKIQCYDEEKGGTHHGT